MANPTTLRKATGGSALRATTAETLRGVGAVAAAVKSRLLPLMGVGY